MELNQLVKNVVVSKWCSQKSDEDADTSKTFKIELTIDNVTIVDMANGLLKNEVIRWQNTNRKKYDKLVDKSTHKVVFKRPIADIDPFDAMVARLQGMTPEQQQLEIIRLTNMTVKE